MTRERRLRVRRFTNAATFLDRAESWLLQAEAEHNLILGIARHLVRGDHRYDEPIYLATVEDEAAVVGCAYRTPPFKLGLTRIPAIVLPLLVQDVAEVYTTLPAVLGPEAEATRFADLWTRQFGGQWMVGMRQRIHVLTEVISPTDVPGGGLRRSEDADFSLATDWAEAFIRDTGDPRGDVQSDIERRINAGSLYLWEDQEPRAMAAAVGQTPRGVRVGYVYTPPSFRRRGYATALVAELSQLLLDGGRGYCFLYTDLANPTSNAIYARIGYSAVCDVIDVHFS